jgi:histidinol phosphatase-like enzyme (inositol monophosphatase family)
VLDPALIAAADAAADAAGRFILPHFRAGLAVDGKSDASPVTEADRGAERVIRELLSARFPAHGLWGEEYGADRADAEWVWLLDPIDGTRAFITGRPLFTTLIALLHRGTPVLGVIDQPATCERWLGAAGAPTRFRGPFGGAAGTRRCATLAEAELGCTAPEIFDAALAPRFERLRTACRRTTWGGDAYGYGLVALGCLDLVCEATLKPWDWAALAPVVQGAGGSFTDWQGRALTLESPGEVLALGDPALLPEALRALEDR